MNYEISCTFLLRFLALFLCRLFFIGLSTKPLSGNPKSRTTGFPFLLHGLDLILEILMQGCNSGVAELLDLLFMFVVDL